MTYNATPKDWFDQNRPRRIVGVGSALVDILVSASDDFVERTGVPKGGMAYFDPATIDRVLKEAVAPPRVVPGGAACNTITGVARLGGDARFLGKRGHDDFGERFEAALSQHGVDTALVHAPTPTGRVLSLITPDSQRTMLTYLGAAAEMAIAEIPPQYFQDSAIALIEGYLVYNRDLFRHAMQTAHHAGARITLDLASFTVVQENHQELKSIVRRYVDILIANEDEARAFTDRAEASDALRALSDQAELAVVKLGARGSLIAYGDQVIKVDPVEGRGVVDTTGAGDLWAAGFLYGLVQGWPLDQCGHLGSICGLEVCRVIGAAIPEEGWQRIHQLTHKEDGLKEVS
ncbi:MAG: adenosine kinase [Desulfobacterales bacterium]|nr:adenosine kinase [Desulfobacterales bacterium]